MTALETSFLDQRATSGERGTAAPVKAPRLNIGCGFNLIHGFINVDKSPACHPDLVFDVETQPWPWPTSSIEQVLFFHSLEHMAPDPNVYLGIIRELYRVCAPQARVRIVAPHPRHDDFINDPTHVRPITPMLFTLFDQERNRRWIEGHFANTPLAIYLGVDFIVESSDVILTADYQEKVQRGELSEEAVRMLLLERNNIAKEYDIILRIRK